jgi:hypothetical protein
MPAADLVRVEDAKAFLKQTGVSDDGDLAGIITRASMWAEQLVGRPLRVRVYTNLRLTGPIGAKLYVPSWPINVTETLTIKLDEVTQTVWKTEANGDVDSFDVVVGSDDPWDVRWGTRNHLYRSLGWSSALGRYWFTEPSWSNYRGQYRILLSYTGGYDPVPDDLQQAVLYLVQKLQRDTKHQATGATVITTATGGSIAIPDPAVPREARELLAPYRRMVLGAV